MASNYPGSLDSFDTIASDKKTSDAVGGRTHRQMHNDLGDAIEAVQSELGTNPSGSDATVAARLSAIEAGTNLATGAVTSAKIANGTIVDADINASAAIAVSKLAGHPTTTVDNTLPRFDGVAGNMQTTGITIADTTNAMSGVGPITEAAMATATLGTELGDGVSLTQALTGLTIGATYQVAAVSGTLTAATLDGVALTVNTNATSFAATATSHTVVGTAGTCTAISVKLVTARSATVALSVAGARVSQQSSNTFVGTIPLKLTTGVQNTAIGATCLGAVTTGSGNIALGANAQSAVTTGASNIGIGVFAQYQLTTGSTNIAMGYAQAALTTGSNNIAIGQFGEDVLTTGGSNVAVGASSLRGVTTGAGNVGLGTSAGRAFTTGSYNLALGQNTGYSGTTATLSGTVTIGTNSSGVGAQATADNQIVLGVAQHNTLIAGSLEMTGNGTGIIVRSPDGTRYRVGVANGGALAIAAL